MKCTGKQPHKTSDNELLEYWAVLYTIRAIKIFIIHIFLHANSLFLADIHPSNQNLTVLQSKHLTLSYC